MGKGSFFFCYQCWFYLSQQALAVGEGGWCDAVWGCILIRIAACCQPFVLPMKARAQTFRFFA